MGTDIGNGRFNAAGLGCLPRDRVGGEPARLADVAVAASIDSACHATRTETPCSCAKAEAGRVSPGRYWPDSILPHRRRASLTYWGE